jgi:Tfp pilus assembly protein PilX
MQSNMNSSDWLTVAANYRDIASLATSAAESAERRDDEQIASATADTNNNSKGA